MATTVGKKAVLRRVEYAIELGEQSQKVETKYVNKPVEKKEVKKFKYMSKEDMKREKVKGLRMQRKRENEIKTERMLQECVGQMECTDDGEFMLYLRSQLQHPDIGYR